MSDETTQPIEPETLTAADLDDADETPELKRVAEVVQAAIDETPESLVEIVNTAAQPNEAGGRKPEPPTENPVEVARRALVAAEGEVTKTQSALEDACQERNVASKAFAAARDVGRNQPLHEINRRQKAITRVESARRFRASEAIKDLYGHFNPAKREHPRTAHHAANPTKE